MADVLAPDALDHELDRLDGWSGATGGISKTYSFADFAEAMRFVNAVADLAEQADHHPDISISWNEVVLTYVTHSAGGVTGADVEQARRVDAEAAGPA
ncbi:MAG TPA: 4a-hydroxytetrahydrobiopterin dehydratase [Egibacteraceae bacterium]|nr:4a-hydroxytetrahydrobiopterin dehydratase [Egibacteraceae bacterium]